MDITNGQYQNPIGIYFAAKENPLWLYSENDK